MTMKTPDKSIRDRLWASVGPELARAVGLFVNLGVTAPKGRMKKEVMIEAMMEVVKTAYLSGLDRGYDLGFSVFGEDDDDDDTVQAFLAAGLNEDDEDGVEQ